MPYLSPIRSWGLVSVPGVQESTFTLREGRSLGWEIRVQPESLQENVVSGALPGLDRLVSVCGDSTCCGSVRIAAPVSNHMPVESLLCLRHFAQHSVLGELTQSPAYSFPVFAELQHQVSFCNAVWARYRETCWRQRRPAGSDLWSPGGNLGASWSASGKHGLAQYIWECMYEA